MKQQIDRAMRFIEANILCDICGCNVCFQPREPYWLEHCEQADHEAVVNPEKALDFAREFWDENSMEQMHDYMWAYVVLDSGALDPEKTLQSYRHALEYVVD